MRCGGEGRRRRLASASSSLRRVTVESGYFGRHALDRRDSLTNMRSHCRAPVSMVIWSPAGGVDSCAKEVNI
jgi:hypothetical protein